VLINLGVVRAMFGDLPGAEQALREAEALAQELGLVIPRAAALVNLSDLHRDSGDLEQARQLADAARQEANRAGDNRIGAAALVARAQCCAPGEDALALAEEAVGQLERIEDASTFIESMGQLARLAADRGERGWASELFTAARARAEATGIERHRRLLDRVDEVLRTPPALPRKAQPNG
jgi:ATP/maltotriose-dependent transcriptional regulator MalT